MAGDPAERSSLRRALAAARRARDEALAELGAREERWRRAHREEQHRLRNMFSVIRTVARRTGEDVETVEDYRGVLDGRLRSYLGIQATLARDWTAGADLALLLAGELLPFDLHEGEGVALTGPPVTLTGRAAGLLALAFHELAAAAILSGGVTGDRPLTVQWQLDGDEERALRIDWREHGAVPPHDEARLFSRAEWVEQMIEHQLAGTMTRDDAGDGCRARIRLPATVMR